uniref:MADF domain-containing protein n=1 Tax=Anopheles melas TaxID=34690 RepID=A0A182UHM4_9DIPT
MDSIIVGSPLFSEPKLIELVKRKPLLWNHKDPYYNNRKLEKDCWAEISDLLETDIEMCKKKWQGLRNQYRRELLRTKNSKWKHYQRLSFLAEVLTSKAKSRSGHSEGEDDDPIRIERSNTPMEQNSSFMEELYDSPYSNGVVAKEEQKETAHTIPPAAGNVAHNSNYYFALSLVELLNAIPKQNQLAARIAILSKINEFPTEQEEVGQGDINNFS